jgi:hypothetical protein
VTGPNAVVYSIGFDSEGGEYACSAPLLAEVQVRAVGACGQTSGWSQYRYFFFL